MVAGGTESGVNAVALAGFSRAKALSSRFNEVPEESSRPFDSHRDGFVLGEGAGAIVLEELEVARSRGARIYAEVRGYGACGDALHITAPCEDGSGALFCMGQALQEGGLRPEDVDYLNAHATSTPLGDNIEAKGIGRLFREQTTGPRFSGTAAKVAVSSTKGAIGHLLGAAGAVESIFSILAITTSRVPATLNLSHPDPSLPQDVCDFIGSGTGTPGSSTTVAPTMSVRSAISNSFGFGGTNASLLFAKFDE
jgi:3-oxoacyl-[acyl-carrier-protein] synthase II